MNLTIEATLHGIAQTLRDRIAPTVHDPFAGEAARLAGLLLTLNASWIDDAAAVRVAENAAIRTLFADAGPAIGDSGLARHIAEAAQSADPGLRISELDRENNRLRGILHDLHAWADGCGDNAGQALSQRIWRALDGFEAARAPRG